MTKSKKFIKLCGKHEVNPDEVPEIFTVEDAFKARGLDIKKVPVDDGLMF